jgi:hypothetical protein
MLRPQRPGVFLVALIVAASSVSLRAGEPQTCGSIENAFQARPCRTRTSEPLRVSFGSADLPKPLPVQRMTHQGLRPVQSAASIEGRHGTVYDPSGSGFQNAFVRGLNVIQPVEKQPVDCAMAKPGDPVVDRSMVRQVHGHVVHSAVIVPVARCR